MNKIARIDADIGVDTIVFPFLGAELGGSHISAFTLGEALVQNFGKRCVVIAADNSLIAKEAARRGLEVATSGERPVSRNNPAYDLVRLASRVKCLRRVGGRPILHSNDIETLQSWGLAAIYLGIPVVQHHRALNRMVLANRLVLKLADAMICISESVRRSIGAFAPDGAATILNPFSLPPDLDRAASRASLIEQYGYETDALIVGFVGNFWTRKRPYFFLDACRTILAKRPNARFVLFGRSGEIAAAQLTDYARDAGLIERTTFAGFRLPAESNIAALDLLLLPAVREPFGRTLVEAMLLGTPYVATDDAGHGEIVSRWGGGVLVDKNATAETFACEALAAIDGSESIVLEPDRRAAIAQELSPEHHARKVLAFYKQAIGRDGVR